MSSNEYLEVEHGGEELEEFCLHSSSEIKSLARTKVQEVKKITNQLNGQLLANVKMCVKMLKIEESLGNGGMLDILREENVDEEENEDRDHC